MADRSISIALEAKVSGFVSGMKTAQKSAEDFADRTAAFAKDNEQHLDRVGKASMVMGGALLAGVALAVKSFMEFDKAMSDVQSSTHETEANMDLLRDAAINAGADTAFSAKEAAKGIDELAKAGVSTKDILGGGLTGALSLAAAGSLGVGDAAEIAASALTQFKLSGDKVPHLADLLSAAAGKAQGSVQDMGAALNQTGLIAASTGLSIEETTGGLAAFASAGLVGSDAGTSFKTMLQSLTPNSVAAASEMEKLGIHAYDQQGKFIGLSKFAGNLKDSMKGLSDEQRNASMKIIFGSDAVRAANVLYEQGASGIADWTDKVNDAGFAAVTASIKQDNLAGDLEKLGGSFDSLLIKSGGGLAESLRGLVQGAEDLVDAFGKIPTPILNAGIAIAGILGAAALLGGAVMTLVPKVVEFNGSLDKLAPKGSKAAGVIGGIGRAAGGATVALIGLQVATAIFTEKDVKSAEDYGQAILKVQKAGADGKGLDAVFQGWDKAFGQEKVQNVNGMSDAIKMLFNHSGYEDFAKGFDGFNQAIGASISPLGELEARLKGLGNQLGALVKGGNAETAAKTFQMLTKEFQAHGKGAQEALDYMPGYRDALKGLASESGVVLEGQDLLDFAMGKVPSSMAGAATAVETYTSKAGEARPITEDMAKALEDLGISASGTVTNLDKFTTALVNAGLLTVSSRDATAKFDEAIDGLDGKIRDIMATEQAHGGVLNEGKTDLDLYSEAGRAANDVLADMTQKGIGAAEAMAKNGASMPEVQSQLGKTYDAMVNTAKGFGLGDQEARNLTGSILHIPPGVNVNTWMSDEAKRMADQTTAALDAIDGRQVNISIRETTFIDTVRSDSVQSGQGKTVPGTAYATGGRVFGPGTTTSDSIPTWLSKDEFVVKASAAKAFGYDNLNRLNGGDTQPLKAGFQYAPAPAPPAPAAMGGFNQSGPVAMTGTLILDSGELMGTFSGIAHQVADAKLNQVSRQVGGMRR
jgi:TP901 family phage tail tape measure protein